MVDTLKNKYHIVIVGAGPAGVSAAYFSKFFDQQNKYDILLLEKLNQKKYDFYHRMCGGCISNQAFTEIYPIKANHIIEKIKKTREYVVDEFILEHNIDGYILDRPAFLHHIIDSYVQKGGEFERDKIINIQQKDNKISLQLQSGKIVKTDYLIAADGPQSFIRKKLDFPSVRTVSAVQYIIDKTPEDNSVIQFFYDQRYHGDYKWIFPNGNSIKIGFPIGTPKEKSIQTEVIEKHARSIAYGDIEKRVKKNILLIGDAAGQTNALSKGGIRPGMFAGKKAAEAIMIHQDPKFYNKEWERSLFSSSLINDVFESIKTMTNDQIIEHLEPFQHSFLFSMIKILINKKYRKYRNIYKGYALEQKIGW